MADLMPDPQDGRGQILLVAAFILAATFISLALVVNSAIFTENLATREDVAGSHDALDKRHEVQSTAGHILSRFNNDTDEWAVGSPKDETIEESIENIAEESGAQQSTQGRLVNVTYNGIAQDGMKIAQDNATRNFTSGGSGPGQNWNVTDGDVESIRDFQINVTNPDADPASLSSFTVRLNDTTNSTEWNMTISEPLSGRIRVEVGHPDYGTMACERDHNGFTIIDVTGATIDGEPCLALGQDQDTGDKRWLGTVLDDSVRVEFEDGQAIEGAYSFIIGDTGDVYSSTNLQNSQNSDLPYFETDAIYSVTLSYEYYTSAVGYETEIRVAPGETPS